MKSAAAILFLSSASRSGIKLLSSKISSMAKTIPIYFEGSSKLECEAVVQSVEAAEGFKEPNCHVVVVDQTVCHPQGGGQPFDCGFIYGISCISKKFEILDARMDRETECIRHIGKFIGE